MEKIKIAIIGYGNLGVGCEKAIANNPDMELVAIFTRRSPDSLKPLTAGVPVYSVEKAEEMKDSIDVAVLCGGSATDLPVQGILFSKLFNTVDSFDTHAKIPEYFKAVDACAKEGGNVSAISIGWDPGMFSINRLYSNSILPCGVDYTFWGPGVSQGHSDAIRRIEGVLDARQYTIPIKEAVEAARSGKNPTLTTRGKHLRDCYVVVADGADKAKIEAEIVNMPNYFADYDTTVNFVSTEELQEKHASIPHGGFVIRSGKTDDNTTHVVEYSLKLDSNPQFTSSVMIAYARAVYKLSKEGVVGCKTAFDIAPGYLSIKSREELMAEML